METIKIPIKSTNNTIIGYGYYKVENNSIKVVEMTITDKTIVKILEGGEIKHITAIPFIEHNHELVVSEKKLSKQEIGEIIIKYLNEKTGKRFRPVASNLKFINARLDEGYTIDDLKYVIDVKVADNKAGRFENLYLRPETLFNATKFQSYVNQELTTNGKKEVESRWWN